MWFAQGEVSSSVCLSLMVCLSVSLSVSLFLFLSLSLSVGRHVDWTLLHSCTCVSLVTELLRALDHSPTAFALAQGCHKIELHLSWWRSAVKRHRKRGHSEALEIRGSRSSRMAASRYGHHSRLNDVAAADQTGDGRLFAASP